MKKAKENSGITLVALIVLIIVMAILITTAIYSGVGSIKYVRFMKIKSEIETLQASVNSWHEKYMNGDENILLRGEAVNYDDYKKEFDQELVTEYANYRLYTAKYLVDDIGIDGIENDYLISIKDRNVILVDGLIYQGEIFYGTKDFEVYNTEVEDPISSVSFDLHLGNNPKNLKEECIFIHNIHFYDNGREIKVSKFNIQYSSDGTNWNTINSTTSKTKFNGNDAYLFKIKDEGTYQVKITDRKGKYIPININDETEINSIEVFNCSFPSFKDNNWQIYTPRQLRFLAEYVNKGYALRTEEDTEEKTKLEKVVENAGHIASDIPEVTESTWIYLMNDLDLGARPGEGSTDEEKWENNVVNNLFQWEPIGIGNEESGKNLIASFDGQNHTIKGVYVNRNSTARSGLFGNAYVIQNLNVKNSYIKGGNYTGGIAGIILNEISNCSNYGIVKGNGTEIGGIVGSLRMEGKITNCINFGKIIAEGNQVGGIVGKIVGCYDESNSQTTVTNCYNSGKINVNGSQVGGIVGIISGSTGKSTVTNCYNKGEVTGVNNKGYIIGMVQTSTINELRKLYYLSSLGTGAIDGTDDIANNIRGTTDNFDNLESFLNALTSGTIN